MYFASCFCAFLHAVFFLFVCMPFWCHVNSSPLVTQSNLLQVWFRNETMFQILWKPMVDEDKLIEYKVSIKPPDAVISTLIIKNKNKPFFITFSGLVPGRAYTISEERFDQDNKPSLLSSNVLRTLPLRPVVIIDKDSITISGFKITWTPPRDVSEFDRYRLSFTNETLPIEKTFEKSDQLEYDIHDNVLPGHTYIVIVKTISGKTLSKPAAVYVTLRPLPVEELKITRNNQSQVVSAVWDINSASYQDTFIVTYNDEDSLDTGHLEMSANQKEIILRNLLPGRKYFIQVMAVSHGMESVATSVSYITPPLAPLVEVTPDSYGLDLVWRSDIKYGQVAFKVEYHRMDSVDNTSTSVLTNDTQLVINNLYPGALYSVQVTSISKYGHQSTSREVYQTVCPRPPNHVTARFVNTSTISVGWETPNLSLISGYLIQYQTEEEKQWMRFDVENTELSKLTTRDLVNLLPGERYLIQVSSVSNTTQSHPVKISWTTPPRPVTHVAALVSPYTVRLKFPRAPGRVELYNITWQGNDTLVRSKEVLYQPAVGTKFVLVNIDGLVPGMIYTFSITSVSYNMHSSVTNVSAQTWPLGSDILLDNSASPFSLILNYIPPLVRNFDMFCFNLSAPASRIPTIEKSVNDNNTRVSFDPVIPGELYHVTVWTASEHELSVPTIVQYRLHPESITKINITEVTNMTVTLSWEIPHGVYSAFEVDYERGSLRTSEPNITITALKPYHNYTFTLTVLAGTKSSLVTKSSPTSVRAQTLESFPGKVRVFYPIEIHAHNITFVWYLSESDYHGVITKFTLSHRMEGTSDWSSVEYAPSKDHGVVTGLNPGRKYTFKIQACTQVGPGPEVVCIGDMPPLPPPPPSHDIFPQTRLHTSSTIEIRFHKNFFSDDNGPILYYTIIVAEDLSKNSALLKMPSWSDVQSFRIWPPYQVLEPCQFFTNTSEVDFTIGRETCPNEAHYCNGPLKQGTTYRVKVRAFTSPELFTDTIYSPPVSTGKDVSWLLVMGFLVLIVLPVLFIIIRRKIVGVTSPRAGGIRGWLPRMSLTRRDTCHPSQDVTLHNCSHPIPVTLFCTMTLDPDWIAVEFEDLKSVGRGQPTTAAELRCNRPKNRYTNIFPYDSSRYKLQPVDDEEGSDYVNANYIGGYLSPRQYIATQGPLCSTVDDFWRMCWESRTPAIVMLTQCIEKHRDKCYKYWPSDQHPMRCADIEISLQDVCHYGSWVLSELRMCRGGEHRMISHYHFTTWPDSGVPSSPNTLVSFVLSFRTHISPAQHPIVVHCSAGVGRTGTFIALDTVLQRLHNSERAGSVDILRIVHGLRRQRVLMVQSLAQYVYIYECVQVYLQGGVRHEERQIQNNEAIERDEGVDDL